MKIIKKEQMVRKQISITKGEFELLEEIMPFEDDGTIETALINGIVNQITKKGEE